MKIKYIIPLRIKQYFGREKTYDEQNSFLVQGLNFVLVISTLQIS